MAGLLSRMRFIPMAAAIIAVLAQASPSAGKELESFDVPLPPRSRAGADGEHTSSRGFRQTVDFYKRFLRRIGLAHEEVPIMRYRGTDVARFISRQRGSEWAAIHVFRYRGQTMIYIVPRRPLDRNQKAG